MSRNLITFSSNNNVVATLPVTPELINIRQGNRIIRSDLLTVGEVATLGAKRLQEISFSSFFPEYLDSYVIITSVPPVLDPPMVWVNRIQNMLRLPIFVIITDLRIAQRFFISDFTWWQNGGEGKDIRYSISLVEYKPIQIRSIFLGSPNDPFQSVIEYPFEATSSTTGIPSLDNKIYIVKAGDTLISISRKTYKELNLIKKINNIKDSSTELTVGKKLYLSEQEIAQGIGE